MLKTAKTSHIVRELVTRFKGDLDPANEGKSLYAQFNQRLRPYLKTAFRDVFDGAEFEDGRIVSYEFELAFWDVDGGEDRGEMLHQVPPAKVKGLPSLLHSIEGAAIDFYDENTPSELLYDALSKRVLALRSSMSRGKGEAMLRARYSVGAEAHMMTARVARGLLTNH